MSLRFWAHSREQGRGSWPQGREVLGVTGTTDMACEVRRVVKTSWKRPRKGRRPGLSPEDPSIQERSAGRRAGRENGEELLGKWENRG